MNLADEVKDTEFYSEDRKLYSVGKINRIIAEKYMELNELALFEIGSGENSCTMFFGYDNGVWYEKSPNIMKNEIRKVFELESFKEFYIDMKNADLKKEIERIIELIKELSMIKPKKLKPDSKINYLTLKNGTFVFDKKNKKSYFIKEQKQENISVLRANAEYKEDEFENMAEEKNEFFQFLVLKLGSSELAKLLCGLLYDWIDTFQNTTVMAFILGDKASGKSTFLDIINNFFYNSIPAPSLSSIIGTYNTGENILKPMVMIKDSNMEDYFGNDKFKTLIGREPITINPKHKDSYISPVLCKILAVGNETLGMKFDTAELSRIIHVTFKNKKFKEEISDLLEYFSERPLEILHCLKIGFDYILENSLYDNNREFHNHFKKNFIEENKIALENVRKDIYSLMNILKYDEGKILPLYDIQAFLGVLIDMRVYDFLPSKDNLTTGKLGKNLKLIFDTVEDFENVKKRKPNNTKYFEVGLTKYFVNKSRYFLNLSLDLENLELSENMKSQIRIEMAKKVSGLTLYQNDNKEIYEYLLMQPEVD